MNALQYTLNYILRTQIPINILELAFPSRVNSNVTLEERMMVECIRPIIMTDMNILGGVLTYIDLNQCYIVESGDKTGNVNMGSFIVDVPKALTANRSIIALYSLVEGSATMMNSLPNCVSPIMAEANKLMTTMTPGNVLQTGRLELVGENKVLIEAYGPSLNVGMLKVSIANNANLENVQPPYYVHVANMVSWGLKMYIYNKLRPQLDVGYLYAGHEIPYVKEVVDSYSDAVEKYEEYRQIWGKVSVLNDTRKKTEYMSMQIGLLA